MDARSEARDLAQNPLPPVIIVDPLTRVYEFEREIFQLNEKISDLIRQKNEALDYAVKNNIREDDRCSLEEKVRKTRSLDIKRFREVFPQEFEMVCDIERKDIRDRLEHIGEKINLTLVDKLVKKPVLEAAQGVVSVKESVSYSVVRK